MRRFVIDTDTASDDAVALVMALREPSVKVEAITVVAGNVPLESAVTNALVSIDMAGTYAPPVYVGAAKPMLRPLFTAQFVHGENGMGEIQLPAPKTAPQKEHAVDAIIDLAKKYPGELELVTLGPLTNVAIACLKAPDIMRGIKKVWIMGGSGRYSGNITPLAEFNIYVDAEAAQIVLDSGIPPYFIGWELAGGPCFINEADMKMLMDSGSKLARFCVECNATLQQFNWERFHAVGFDLCDPTAMSAALYPETVAEDYDAWTYIEHKSEAGYGQLVIDYDHVLGKAPNATVCGKMNAPAYKKRLFAAIID